MEQRYLFQALFTRDRTMFVDFAGKSHTGIILKIEAVDHSNCSVRVTYRRDEDGLMYTSEAYI